MSEVVFSIKLCDCYEVAFFFFYNSKMTMCNIEAVASGDKQGHRQNFETLLS